MRKRDDSSQYPEEIAGKVVVVTGSTRGVGLAVARGFGKLGARIVFNGRSGKTLAAVVKAARSGGMHATGVLADAASVSGAGKLIAGAYDSFGRVDVLVNNAGISGPPPLPFWQLRASDWTKTITTNLTGPMLCSSAYIRKLRSCGMKGRILNVSSTAGSRGYPGLSPYCASKFGLQGFTECQALDLEGTDVVVVCLALASHRTSMTKRRLPPGDYADLPSPDNAFGLFLYAATGPPRSLHGRTLSEKRFHQDPDAESRLGSRLAMVKPWLPFMRRFVTDPPPPAGSLHLDFLENVVGASPSAHRTVRKTESASIVRYPDPKLASLRNALAAHLGLPAECFTFGNGSTELVERVLRTFTREGDTVIATDPTWPVFERFCHTRGVELRQVSYTVNRKKWVAELDLDDILEAVDSRTRLVYLVNPNNPLGAGISGTAFGRFLERLPPSLPVVVDEAYIEFAENVDMLRANRVIAAAGGRPVIGIRTFSKFHGLAGIRIGYAFADPETIRLISRLHLPFAVSGIAEPAAVAAIKDSSHAGDTRAFFARGRKRLRGSLARMGIPSLSSEANFVMAAIPAEPVHFYTTLEEDGIFLPEVHWNGFMQLPVPSDQDRDRLLRALGRFRRRNDA